MTTETKQSLQFGYDLNEFLRRIFHEERLPKELKDRSIFIYIYVMNSIVDKLCFVSARPNVFNRFIKNTDLVVENSRIWYTPKRKYALIMDNLTLTDDKLYLIQYKHTFFSNVYEAYVPPTIIGHKHPTQK